METIGTVEFQNFEGGFFGIIGDDGQNYRPVNQPRKVKAGDRVVIKWIEAGEKSGHQMWGKPIRLISLEVFGSVGLPLQEEPQLNDNQTLDTNPTEPSVPLPTIQENTFIEFENESYKVKESSSEVSLTVKRSGSMESPCSVEYVIAPLTAEESKDYQNVLGVINFNKGEERKEISIKIMSDNEVEATEHFTVRLTNASRAFLGSLNETIIEIEDDSTVEIEDDTQNSVGTICYIELEKSFYGIITEQGEKLLSSNLPRKFSKDGLKVRFSWRPTSGMVDSTGWGKQINILDMELEEDNGGQSPGIDNPRNPR